MSDPTVSCAKRIVAGAAHGAWMGLLIGVLVTWVSWAVFMAMMTFAPHFIATVTGWSVQEIWNLTLRWYAGLKLLLFGWAIFASFLSFWWKKL